MTLARLAQWMAAQAPRRLLGTAALLAAVQLAGLALLGLSGWFVAAAAAAGLAGLGLTFDVFRPSALIRLTTPLRALARYGERMVGHDATLRILNRLRLRLFEGLAGQDAAGLARLRSAEGVNRLTADLDALEGLPIRLGLPALALPLTLAAGSGAVWLLAGPMAAAAVLACHLGALAGLMGLAWRGLAGAPAAQEAAFQALRARSIEEIRLRAESAMDGALPQAQARVMAASAALEVARARIDRVERGAAALLGLAPMLALAAVLALSEAVAAPQLAAALLALSMAEALRALWRGLAEIGRMRLAAARLTLPAPQAPAAPAPAPVAQAPLLWVQGATVGAGAARLAPVDLSLHPGDWAGLIGPSGVGKTSLLSALAGLAPLAGGRVQLMGHDLVAWPEGDLRARLTLVPQRPALIGGTVAENLDLAAPGAPPAAMQAALEAVALWPALEARQGLATPLGAQGAGLSGGEARRLALARAILRRPAVLLLDEPTEGLDHLTARAVLAGLRAALPQAAVLVVSHRAEDRAGVGQIVQVRRFVPRLGVAI